MTDKKVLFVVDEFWPVESAPAVRIHSLLGAFKEESADVLAGCFEKPAATPPNWRLFKRKRSGHPVRILFFLSQVLFNVILSAARGSYSAIIISVPKYELLLAVPVLKLFKINLIIDVRDTLEFVDYEAYFLQFMPRFLAKPFGLIARSVSNYLRSGAMRQANLITAANQAILNSLLMINPETILVSNGVDTDHFLPSEKPAEPDEFLELVYMGNFVEKDDFKLLSDALNATEKKIRVNLIGEGRHKKTILSILGPEAIVHDFGRVPHKDIPAILGRMHIGFIFRPENVAASIPVALYEFTSVNLPVLCNDTGIMGDFVRKHKLGWVVNTPEELKSALQNVLKDPSLLKGYKHLHAYAEENFSRKASAKLFAEKVASLQCFEGTIS